MVVIIKSQDNANPELFRTKAPSGAGDKITGSFFDQNSFNIEKQPQWKTNYAAGRDGGYKHYEGNKDAKFNVVLHLTGTSRFTDFSTWETMADGTTFYLNSDFDDTLDGNYVIVRGPKKINFPAARRIDCQMIWEKNNN